MRPSAAFSPGRSPRAFRLFCTLGPLVLTGCGGGGSHSSSDVSTGANGRLADVQVGPRAGAVFVDPAATFQLAWPDPAAPPPATFGVALRRFQEPRGGESEDVSTQNVTVSQPGPAFVYNVGRKDRYPFDVGGVYYLDLHASTGETRQIAFIVDGGPTTASNRSEQTASPGTGGLLSGLAVAPAPGAVGIPKNTTFGLAWPGPVPPPSQFTVSLHRYEEARGTDAGDNSEQNVTLQAAGLNAWSVRRKDGYDLDGDATYYLEVSAPGQDPVRIAYLTSS